MIEITILNPSAVFTRASLNGRKTCYIGRLPMINDIHPGDVFGLAYKYETGSSNLYNKCHVCKSIHHISFQWDIFLNRVVLKVDGKALTGDEAAQLAFADGFTGSEDDAVDSFLEHYKEWIIEGSSLFFEAQLIKW